jgi:hypothetical protein
MIIPNIWEKNVPNHQPVDDYHPSFSGEFQRIPNATGAIHFPKPLAFVS